jgi:hypothetical protein
MTTVEVALTFHGVCERDHDWCRTHEHDWPDGTSECPVMVNHIDFADQAVNAYREALRLRLGGLIRRHTKIHGGWVATVALEEVWAQLEEEQSHE